MLLARALIQMGDCCASLRSCTLIENSDASTSLVLTKQIRWGVNAQVSLRPVDRSRIMGDPIYFSFAIQFLFSRPG